MNLEEFRTLTDDEQAAILADRDNLTTQVENLQAERNSFETENKDLTEKVNTITTELAKTKEVNYTLTRKLNLDKDTIREPEDIIKDMFMKGE